MEAKTNSEPMQATAGKWTYFQTERHEFGGLWTVGFYKPDGEWMPESDHESPEEAAARVHYLNGGTSDDDERIAAALAYVEGTPTEVLEHAAKEGKTLEGDMNGLAGKMHLQAGRLKAERDELREALQHAHRTLRDVEEALEQGTILPRAVVSSTVMLAEEALRGAEVEVDG